MPSVAQKESPMSFFLKKLQIMLHMELRFTMDKIYKVVLCQLFKQKQKMLQCQTRDKDN